MQRIDARKQRRVHADGRPVPRHHRRHLALDQLERLVGVRACEVVEDSRRSVEVLAGAFQRVNDVGEADRRGLGGNRRDLCRMRHQRDMQGR